MAKANKRRLMGDINVVPYIDVMLVLLIIFMITAPLLTQGVEVELPKAAAEPLDDEQIRNNEPLVLSVTADGSFYLNVGDRKNSPVDEGTALAIAAAVMRRSPETPVLVRGDETVDYGRVITAMVLLQKAGAEKIGFMTEAPEIPGAP